MTDSAGAAPVGARQRQDVEKGDTRMDTTVKGTDSRTAMEKPVEARLLAAALIRAARAEAECGEETFVSPGYAFHDELVEQIAPLVDVKWQLYGALKEIVAALQADAPGTPLNNHKYDALGMQARKAISRAEADD